MIPALSSCKLYGIVDMGYTEPDAIERTTAALLQGGIRILQLRAKQYGKEDILRFARIMQPLCHRAGALFVMNDYPDLAVKAQANAVHVGQDAGALSEIRRLVGERMLVGRSTHSPEQAAEARREGADYIGFGPLFPTGTKPGRPAIGLQDIAQVQRSAGDMPVFCIGGINGDTLPAVLAHGAQRVVVVSWLLLQRDITSTTRALLSALP